MPDESPSWPPAAEQPDAVPWPPAAEQPPSEGWPPGSFTTAAVGACCCGGGGGGGFGPLCGCPSLTADAVCLTVADAQVFAGLDPNGTYTAARVMADLYQWDGSTVEETPGTPTVRVSTARYVRLMCKGTSPTQLEVSYIWIRTTERIYTPTCRYICIEDSRGYALLGCPGALPAVVPSAAATRLRSGYPVGAGCPSPPLFDGCPYLFEEDGPALYSFGIDAGPCAGGLGVMSSRPAAGGGRIAGGDTGTCRRRGAELPAGEAAAAGLTPVPRWALCLAPGYEREGQPVCPCTGCGPACPRYEPDLD
jgi:hypothetical protein